MLEALAAVFGLVAAAGAPPARPGDGPPDLVAKAYAAAEEARYCDAVPLFLALHGRAPQAKHLYRAAEVAYAARDHRMALDLYRSVLAAYPTFEKARSVADKVKQLEQLTGKGELGEVCPEPARECGDWVVVPGEQCDDGNLADGDACDGNCTLSSCGNGVRAGAEACDDGNLQDGDGCDANCTPSSCGNGIVAPPEQCDDGNQVDGDGCDRGCVYSGCGNGVLGADEECDDGNAKNGDGCDRNCTRSRCGNGALQSGEECDDGDSEDGDGCDAGCRSTRCGNGVVTAGERCDDGNLTDGDGCDSNCTPTGCGNGIVTEGERCEDGAADEGMVLLGGGLTFAGAALTASSLVLAGFGAVPALDHTAAAAAIEEAEGRADQDLDGALEDARTAQTMAAEANRRWLSYGAPLMVTAAASLLVGVALGTTGIWLWTEHAPPPMTPGDPKDEERIP
ncbi:MAG: DUF4215 domain-containing protein [Deltaproteobacteria bacterium]|nr:DUF4215 domain-containing protein [Deltaproteobacteria bacterium]